MKKKGLFLFVLILLLSACTQTTTSTTSATTTATTTTTSGSSSLTFTTSLSTLPVSQAREFDFDVLNDALFDTAAWDGSILYVEGHNIADGDYLVEASSLILQKGYLATLAPGLHDFTVRTTERTYRIQVDCVDATSVHKIVNAGFETGDLLGWTANTVFKSEWQIQAFVPAGIKANTTLFTFQVPYGGDGSFVYGMDDRDGLPKDQWNERIGILQSSVFVLGGSGWITFKLGGGKNSDLTYVSIRNAVSDVEVARFGNHKFRSVNYLLDPTHYFEGNLVLYRADLSGHLGEKLVVEFVDMGGRDWDLLTFDSIDTYHVTIPGEGELAIDIAPSFSQPYVPNQLPNADFASGLSGWTVSSAAGWKEAGNVISVFEVTERVLSTNASGVVGRGLIRSGLFRIDGAGIVSFELQNGRGSRFDKDTFISIREFGTNRELFRFANDKGSTGAFHRYYADLSAHLESTVYIEIVDNGRNAFDVLHVRGIVTYFAVRPTYDFTNVAVNLNR